MHNSSDFDEEHWRRAFDEEVQRDRHAARSWTQLTEVGIPADDLAGLLSLACDFEGSPGAKIVEPFVRPDAAQIRAVNGLADQLEQSARSLAVILKETADQDLIGNLNATAAKLRQSVANANEMISKRHLNPGFFLALLFSEIEQRCGSQHYRDVANLLGPAYLAHGQDVPYLGEDSLRTRYRRFKSDNPLASLLSAEAKKNIEWILFFVVVFVIIADAAGHRTATPKTPEP